MRLSTLFLLVTLAALSASRVTAQAPTRTQPSPIPVTNGAYGVAVTIAGDVDADGIEDYAVGEPGTGSGTGRVHVYSGSTGTLIRTLASPELELNGYFGDDVAGVGDLNDDGVPDLLIGADSEDPGASPDDAGRAYVFSGLDGTVLDTLASPNEQFGGSFGDVVASAGDLTGDGRSDLLIGAYAENSGQGSVYVFDGATGVALLSLTSPTPEIGGQFGSAVVSIDDMDGDGIREIAVGAPVETVFPLSGPVLAGAGQVHLFSGATGAFLQTLQSPTPEAGGSYGVSLGALYANDSTSPDLVVGAWREDPGTSPPDAGRVYFYRLPSGVAPVVSTLAPLTQTTGGHFGVNVASIGDFNGDGVGDIAVQATDALGGRVYVVDGFYLRIVAVLDSPNAETFSRFGNAIAAADLDGDGYPEVLVGANGETVSGQIESGRVYTFGATDRSTVDLTGTEGWRLLSAMGGPTDHLLDSLWTQGYPGADVSQGDANVFLYSGYYGWLTPTATARGHRRGIAVYVFEDDDLFQPGVQGGFPKTLQQRSLEYQGAPFDYHVEYYDFGNNDSDGWNLLANPFDASLDWDAAGWVKAHMDNVVYVYDPASGTYLTWNGTTGALGDGHLSAYQGFWVKAHATDPALVAPEAARDPLFFPPFYGLDASASPSASAEKGTTSDEIVLGLRADATVGGVARAGHAFLHATDRATAGHDRLDAYALPALDATSLTLAFADGDLRHTIEARPVAEGITEIGLDVALTSPEGAATVPVTVTWPRLEAVPADWSLVLRDTQTGTEVDLRHATSYTFTATTTSKQAPSVQDGFPAPRPMRAASFGGGSRFVLVVGAASVGTETDPRRDDLRLDVAPNPTTGRARIAWQQEAAYPVRVAVHDALGREVAVLARGARTAGRHEVTWETDGLAAGLYLVRITTPTDTQVTRLTLAR